MKNPLPSHYRHLGQHMFLVFALPSFFCFILAVDADSSKSASPRVFRVPCNMYMTPQHSLPHPSKGIFHPQALDNSFRTTVKGAFKATMEGHVNSLPINPSTTPKFSLSLFRAPTPAHETALNYCAHLASNSWISSKEVRVKITFIDTFDDMNTLGDCRPSSGWFLGGHVYPIAMMKSILKNDLNAQESGDDWYDIVVRLNSHAKWYLGTDKRPGPFAYDLVTVCLHELYHGLMSSGGNIEVVRGARDGKYRGRFVNSQFMWRYDAFVAVGTAVGDCALSSYKREYRALGNALTSNNVWFRGTNGRVARLHAPRPFEDGSSLYHLAEGAYDITRNGNGLMMPSIEMGYANHDIGPVVRKMQELMLNESDAGAPICNPAARPILLECCGAQGNQQSQIETNSTTSKSPSSSPTQSPARADIQSRSPAPSLSGTRQTFSMGPTEVISTPFLSPTVTHKRRYDPTPSKILRPSVARQTSTPYSTTTEATTPSAAHPTTIPLLSATGASTPTPSRSRVLLPTRYFATSSPKPSPSSSPSQEKGVVESIAECFPNSGIVELEFGGEMKISRLRVGDRVRTGTTSFSDVILFTHKDNQSWAEFVRIEVRSKKSIDVSQGHLIFVGGELKTARNVTKGDLIHLASGKQDVVTSVQRLSLRGLHNPQTIDGSIVVNGIIASTYTEAVDVRVATAFLAPIRALFEFQKCRSTYGKTSVTVI